ncbi:Integrase catalytic domain-containing protein [Citrus sinensis]|uniref:Integrase catalytic domain-containing protein n=1 Tax=Citrus sinensis TaxID=2711 RepID=A0ACB8KJZ7_CITSI|nr:Integrase catalytic domain-containing protein [Citrus sinensis]
MVEGETSRIGERSTETISGDTSGGRRDLSNRYSAPVIRGQKIDVEKFDGKINFGMWRREVMDVLIQIDLDVVLKNKRHLYDEEIWDRMNEKAYGQIRSCLTKEVNYLVKDEECTMTLWCTLEEKYLVKSPENRLHAMSQVYDFRMKPGVSMHDHVSRFEKLVADLKNLDEDIKDEVKTMILLHSLPEEYSHFVTTLIYGKSVIVFKDVCTTLTSLEIQNNDKNSERASSEALVSRDWAMEKQKKRGGKNSRSKSISRNIARDECAFCHEKGHWRKDCPKAQKRDGKKPAAANMAWKDEDSDYSLSITPGAYVASSSEWILDTGVTYHLCPIKEWFTDFRNLESGAVVMGNDQPCRTMGIGTIRLKMFYGMIRELKEVRFVPALKKNLISVGALEVKGYKVTMEDGIMKFTHGAMVILQGVRRHNLYYLKGGKKTRVKFGTANHDTREILKYVHSDVWRPTKTASIGGSHYFVTFVNDFSRRVWVYNMRVKDEVLEIFVKWKKLVETQTSRKIKVLRYDNGGEYTSDPFLQVCQNEEYELKLAQLDVKTAFLHGDLEEEIYMIQPCGFRVAGKENHVYKLIKSLYGLKQSPRQWYKRFDQFIQGQKFTTSEHDHCVYFRRLLDGAFIYLLLYVDDMLIASKNRDEIERLKKQLASEFEMKDLGDAQKILGMEIRRDKNNGSVWLTQKSYLKKVLERFGMDDKTKPVCTPLAPHFKLSSSSCPRSQEERDYMARVPYASAVGSLMYAMVCTRPNISQAVSMVSRYMYNPGKNHWLVVKWILRYLYGTIDVGLLFKKDCGQQCVGYCDSDFAGDLDKRRSTTGYVFTLGGGTISWRSILQSTIALSTTEAEYMAATEAVKEAIWLKGLLGDLGVIQENIAVFCDNQSAIFLAKNQTYHARTKHIDVKYHYVREIIEGGDVLLKKIGTKDNPSDMLTKVVSRVKFQHYLKLIQIL